MASFKAAIPYCPPFSLLAHRPPHLLPIVHRMADLPAYIIAFDILVFMPTLLTTATILTVICSSRLQRGRAWLGMMSCWLVYSLSYAILVGRQTGPEPTFAHCLVQTMLIYAAPPLVTVGFLCFYLDFYLGICWDSTHYRPLRPRTANLLLALPWIVHFAIDVEVIILAVRNDAESVVGRTESNMYCHFRDNNIPGLVNATIVILTMGLLIPLEVWTSIQLYKHRTAYVDANFRKYLAVHIRVAVCTIVACIAFGFSVTTFADVKGRGVVEDLTFPCLSMTVSLVFVVFASQQDLLNVWLCRRRSILIPSPGFIRSVDQNTPEESKALE